MVKIIFIYLIINQTKTKYRNGSKERSKNGKNQDYKILFVCYTSAIILK